MLRSETLAKLGAALAQFQIEVKNPSNTAVNPQFRSKYAPLEVVINTVKPLLAKHGLTVIQSTGSEGENIVIKTMILHESGEWIESDPLILPAYQLKSGGVKEFNAQGAGSALTYARRYSLSAALNLSSEDDDDANGQAQGSAANPVQVSSLKDKMAAKTQAPPATIPESLKEKYKQGKGNLDGLEKWVADQQAKGKTFAQLEKALDASLQKAVKNDA